MAADSDPELILAAARAMLEPLALMEAVRDADGNIVDLRWTFINAAGAEQVLVPAEDLLGARLLDVLPEHRHGLFENYRTVIETGEPFLANEVGYDDTWGSQEIIPRIYNIRATRCGDGVAISWNDVTDNVSDRHSLRKTNSRMQIYEQIVELAGIGIWVEDANNQTTYVNKAMCAMLGREPHELLGRARTDFMDDSASLEYESMSDADDEPRSQRDVRFQNAAGESVWGRLSMTNLVGEDGSHVGSFAMIADVSDEVRATRGREIAQTKFQETTEKAPIGHALIALDGRLLEVNAAFCEISGYTHNELLELTFEDITAREDIQRDRGQLANLRTGSIASYSMDKRLVRRDGSSSWVKLFMSAVRDNSGNATQLIGQLIDIDRQKKAEETAAAAIEGLAYRSTHDVLTELPNRNECVRELRVSLSDRGTRRQTAVLFIDIDHFKEVNDGISHSAGDTVLSEIGRRIRSSVRSGDLVSRLGGDEFAVVTKDRESVAELEDLAERVRTSIADRAFEVVGARLHITVSIGVAQSQPGSSPQSLLSEADLALYRAKELGRNRWQLADREMLRNARARLSLLDRMHIGVEQDEFHAWYQPVADLGTREIVGFESLARWEHANGVMTATEFIKVAEDSGLIHELGATVITESIEHLADISPDQTIAINASPHQLQAPTFAQRVLSALAAAEARPEQLILEITEQALLKAGTASDTNLARLHGAGVLLYVDDFGVGYSSLAILRDYPIDGIKLDRSFSADFAEQSDARMRLVSGLSQLAAHMGLDRIAEGIESENQLDYLVETGWLKGQGFLFGSAQPASNRTIPNQNRGPVAFDLEKR